MANLMFFLFQGSSFIGSLPLFNTLIVTFGVMKSLLSKITSVIIAVTTIHPLVSAKQWGMKKRIGWSGYRHSFPSRNGQEHFVTVRGGSSESDEERYSRQVYTLGARAHGMVRSATVYVDGPSESGLLYECIKNLALSGIGKIIMVSSDEKVDKDYHSAIWDDLGRTYITGAKAELGLKDDDNIVKASDITVEFLQKLNPSLTVETITRDELRNKDADTNGILLCVDRPYDTQLEMNRLSRDTGLSFVAVETAGVYGRTFCDFGSKFEIHDIDGETPLIVPLDSVEILEESEKTIRVKSVSGEKHDVSKGDEIQFQLENGEVMNCKFHVVRVHNPESITIKSDDSRELSTKEIINILNSEGRSFTRLKKLELISFLSLEKAIIDSKKDGTLFTPCDLDKSFDESRRSAIFSSFQALCTFVKSNQRLPGTKDWESFLDDAKEARDVDDTDVSSEWEHHCRSFMKTCAAKFVPIQAIFGAVASQECLKAASGLYNPIRQFLLYDCDEVLPSLDCDVMSEKSMTTGQGYIFGEKVEKGFRDQSLFVVGAGAIGCELLKNLAAMNAATGERGLIIVTDMDTIERSNLSRQLLFRDIDIGNFKSKAAQEVISRMNPSLKMECHTSKVGEEGDTGPFNGRFWSNKVDVVLNALDNVEARLFMDSQCVANEKTLIDAGTLGSKGNVQVVVPHQSESYGSSVDPPEPAIPVCTLKNFPYAISHTIQWGRDLFDGLFVRRPKQANDYAKVLSQTSVEGFARRLEQDLGEQAAINAAKELSQDLISYSNANKDTSLRKDCIDWAISLADDLFYDAIQQLLIQHPEDSLDEDGEPFWSGSRKIPKGLLFSSHDEGDSQQSLINQNYVDFVRYAARLRIETLSKHSTPTGESIISEEEAHSALQGFSRSSKSEADGAEIHELLRSLQSFPGLQEAQNIAEFEKDDDSNGHIAFITAASNLRAMCYGIPPVDAMETRRVAGKIVPAMITTTAFVSALSCIELMKAVQSSPIKDYRNAFINLALPFFAFTMPLPAEEFPGLHGTVYTLWDRITVKEGKKTASKGGITLRQFLKRLKKKVTDEPEAIEIATVSFGQFMIYANFLNEDDDELLDRYLWDVIQEAIESGNEFDEMYSRETTEGISTNYSQDVLSSSFVDLVVVVGDLESEEEVELPPVRVIKYKS